MVHIRGRVVFDDQRPHHAARDLLLRDVVRVIPVGARVWRNETVGHAIAGIDQVLREHRHAVHLVLQADAMPVDGGAFLQTVLHLDRRLSAALQPYLRPRHRPIEAKHRGGPLAFGQDLLGHRLGLQLQRRLGCRAADWKKNRSGAGQKLSSVHREPHLVKSLCSHCKGSCAPLPMRRLDAAQKTASFRAYLTCRAKLSPRQKDHSLLFRCH